MKIAIIGSRNLEEDWIYSKLASIFEDVSDDLIISGGAKGVDSCVEYYCVRFGISLHIIKPINPANKLDYLFRNVEIITLADKIYALWDGKSKGTKFVIDYAKARGKQIEVIMK